jgi:hypothetical protein
MDTKTTKPLPISVSARRWYDGQNTYHSVSVTFDDGSEAVEPFEYGYGDHWQHTAGLLIGDDAQKAYHTLRRLRESGHVVATDCVDVQRKRDLHNGGKRERASGGAR